LSIIRLVLPFLLLALTTCSEFKPYSDPGYAQVVSRGYGVNYWLKELYSTRGMTSAELQQTVSSWEQEFLDDPDTGNRIRLAMLLTAGDNPARAPKRARELLEGLEATQLKTSELEMVAILRQILDCQYKADMTISKLNKQIRQQSERIEELEQQQQALTDIEQNIQQRDIQPEIEQNMQQLELEQDIDNGNQ